MHPPVETTELGSLEIQDVYASYDGPRLYSCRDSSGQLYVAVWVDESETADVWLYAPVTPRQLDDLESDRIDLRGVFAESTGGVVYQVTTFHRHSPAKVKSLACSEIPEEWLPMAGSSLSEPRVL